MNIISSDYEMFDTVFDLNMNVGHYDLYFIGPVILLNISKIIWHMHIIFPDYEMVWHNLWPQYDCKSLWPIFHGLVILLCIWKPTWHMNIILPDFEMVWHNYSPQYECKSLWPIFHGPVILLYISKTIWHMRIIFPDYEMVWHNLWPQYDCKSLWPYISWSSDFCPISESPFDIWTSYFQIMKWYDTVFNLNMNVSHCDLYFMVQWFCFISRRIFDICTSYS